MDFSQIVKIARQKTGMSQLDFACTLHLSLTTINRWENGKARPNQLTKAVFFAFCKERGIQIENADDAEA